MARAHPYIPLFVGGQDHRHCLRVDRLNDGVRRGRQEAINKERSGGSALESGVVRVMELQEKGWTSEKP